MPRLWPSIAVLPLLFSVAGCPVDEPTDPKTTPPDTDTTTDSPTDTDTGTPGTTLITTTPTAVVVEVPVAVGADVESLLDGDATGVASLDPHRHLVSTSEELVAVDPFGALDVWAGLPGPLQSAVPWGEVVLVVADGTLHDWDGAALRPSVLADLVGPASVARAHEGALWIGADQGLVRWQAGEVVAVTVEEAPVGPFAVGGAVRGNGVVWAGQGDVLHALGNAGTTWVDLEAVKLAGEVDSVAVDGRGIAWAAAGGWAYRRDPATGWQRLDFGQPIWEVYAHPQASGAWLEAEGTWLFDDDGTWQEVTGLPAPSAARPPEVDSFGRLMLWDETGAKRASTTRPLTVVGLADSEVVGRVTDVTLLPTAPDEVQELRGALVDAKGAEVPLDEVAPGIVRIDPDGIASGLWTFRAEADYGDRVSTSTVPVFLGAAYTPTWDGDIEPLYRAECAFCHGGDADTVLEEPEDWEPIIEAIVYNVEVGNMPLGGDPLSDVEVVLIEAWRDAGFPR